MKLVKKICVVLFAALFFCAAAIPAFAAGEENVSVSLRIEGAENNLYYDTVTVPVQEGLTALDIIEAADNASEELEVTIVTSEYGSYVSAVNGESEGQIFFDGWMFIVNGAAPDVGISDFEVQDGDAIVLYYSDAYGEEGFQIPEMDLSRLDQGILKFVSEDTTYDEYFEPHTAINPVVGATVTWGYPGGSARYTTNENGEIQIEAAQLTAGEHSVQIEKYSKTIVSGGRLPLVLRFPSDTVVTVEQSAVSSQPENTASQPEKQESSSSDSSVSDSSVTDTGSSSPKTGEADVLGTLLPLAGICFAGLFLCGRKVND